MQTNPETIFRYIWMGIVIVWQMKMLTASKQQWDKYVNINQSKLQNMCTSNFDHWKLLLKINANTLKTLPLIWNCNFCIMLHMADQWLVLWDNKHGYQIQMYFKSVTLNVITSKFNASKWFEVDILTCVLRNYLFKICWYCSKTVTVNRFLAETTQNTSAENSWIWYNWIRFDTIA